MALRYLCLILLCRTTLAAWGGDPQAINVDCYTIGDDEVFIDFDGELMPRTR